MFYICLVSSILLKIRDQSYDLQVNAFPSTRFVRSEFSNSLYYGCSVGQCRFKLNNTIQGIYISNVDNSVYKVREIDGDIVIDNLSSLYSLSFVNPDYSSYICDLQLYIDVPMDFYELVNLLSLFNVNLNVRHSEYAASMSKKPNDPKTISILISNNSTLLNNAGLLTVSGYD